MIQTFISYFFIFIFYTILLYGIGFLMLYSLNIKIKKPFTKHFASWLIGLTIFTILSALYFTNGVTVMIFLIPLLIYFANKYKPKINETDLVDKIDIPYFFSIKFIVLIFIAALLLFLFRAGQIYTSSFCIPFTPSGDLVFYANCIDFLTHFGYENSACNYLNPKGVNPYHYFELWQSAGFSNLLGLNTTLTLVLITFPLLNLVVVVGIVAILEQFKKVETIDFVLCFFLLFTTGFVFDLYARIPFMADIAVYALNPITMMKHCPNYIFIIAAVLFFINKYEDAAIVCLLALPVIHIANALSIYPGIICWYFISFIRNRKINYSIAAILIFSALLIFIFYLILPQANSHVSAHFTDIFSKFSKFLYWKTAFNIVAGASIQFFIIFIFFVLFYIYNFDYKSIFIKEIILVVLVYCISLFGWALLNYKLTSTQIFSHISVDVFAIISILIVIAVWAKKKRTIFNVAFIALVVVVGISNSMRNYYFGYEYTNTYLSTLKNESKNFSLLGAYMRSKDDYNFSFSYVTTLSILGNYLVYFDSKTFPVSLSDFNFPFSSNASLANIEKETLATAPFWIYVENQKAKGVFESIDKSQVQFIDEYKINYLICTKSVVLSNLLQQKIKLEIIDDNTGERFYLMK